jgi:hypothetical protein
MWRRRNVVMVDERDRRMVEKEIKCDGEKDGRGWYYGDKKDGKRAKL